MSDNLNKLPGVIQKSPPNMAGQPQVFLKQNSFDAIIWSKGYEVFLDKSIKCPCRNKPDGQALSSCRNCGGSGWVFINRTATKIVLQSMNLDTKYKEWSEEKLGTARVSVLNNERISFMDRIILNKGVMIFNETLFPHISEDDKLICRTVYDILEIDNIFLFEGSNTPLKVLKEGTDFEIQQGNWIVLLITPLEEIPTISIRYAHRPTYHIIDLTRGVMESPKINSESGRDEYSQLPIAGVARLAHYVLDQQGYGDGGANYLLDNSYEASCDVKYKTQCNQ